MPSPSATTREVKGNSETMAHAKLKLNSQLWTMYRTNRDALDEGVAMDRGRGLSDGTREAARRFGIRISDNLERPCVHRSRIPALFCSARSPSRDTERSRLTLTRTNGSKVPASQQRSHGKVPVLIQRRCCANSVLRRVEVNVLPASSIPSAQGQAIWRRLRDGRFIARSRHMSRCFPPLHASNSRINGR